MALGSLRCCFLDGSPCQDFFVENDDSGLSQAELDCANLGGCIAKRSEWGATCEQLGCMEDQPFSYLISCCDLETGVCSETSFAACNSDSKRALCPVGCSEDTQLTCEELAAELHVCCVGEFCLLTTASNCIAISGDYRWTENECTETCEVGCRDAIEPFTPTFGPEWGQKTYTLDLCYPAPMLRVRPPQSHGLAARRGRGVPMTAFEVRAVAQVQAAGAETDPCARAYGVLARGEDGRRRPYLCSQTDPNVTQSATYSQGYFSKALDNNGPILRGRRARRAGVMTEPHREVQYNIRQLICGQEI